MISRKFHRLVFAFFMSIIMSCVMSFAISLANVGLVADFFWIWMDAWFFGFFGFFVAFAGVFTVSPLVHKLTEMALHEQSKAE